MTATAELLINRLSQIDTTGLTWTAEANSYGTDLYTELNLKPANSTSGKFTFDVLKAARAYHDILLRQHAPSAWLRPVTRALASLAGEASEAVLADGVAAAVQVEGLAPSPWWRELSSLDTATRPRALTAVGRNGSVGARTAGDPTVGLSLNPEEPASWVLMPPGELGGRVADLAEEAEAAPPDAGLSAFLRALSRGVFLYPLVQWSGALDLIPLDAPDATAMPALYLVDQFEVTVTPGAMSSGRVVTGVSLMPGEAAQITLNGWEKARGASHVIDSVTPTAAERLRGLLDGFAATAGNGRTIAATDRRAQGRRALTLPHVPTTLGTPPDLDRNAFRDAIETALRADAAAANTARAEWLADAASTISGAEGSRARSIGNINLRRSLTFEMKERLQTYTVEITRVASALAFHNGRASSWADSSSVGSTDAFVRRWLDGPSADVKAQLADLLDTSTQRAEKFDLTLQANHVEIEPLVGSIDALDDYARALQEADREQKDAAAGRTRSLTSALESITDGTERAKAYAAATREDAPLRLEVTQPSTTP